MLPAKARLRKSREFQAVFSKGKSAADSLLVLYTMPRSDECVRFGFSVGRKIGGAVQRNRVKRLLREAARKFLPEITPGRDLVIIARVKAKDASFAEVVASLGRLLVKSNASARSEV